MIGVVTGQAPSSPYLAEVLAHAGLPWRALRTAELDGDGPPERVLVLPAAAALPAAARDRLVGFVRQGGALVALGGTAGLDDLLGVADADPPGTLDEGYLALDSRHPLTAGLTSSLHIFGAARLRATAGTSLGCLLGVDRRPAGADAVVVHRAGRGVAVTIAADLPAAILRIQQGRPIDRDGEPAPDGTAAIDDGILKTDDGVVLSWAFDRERTPLADPAPECPGLHPDFPRGDTPWFARPIADELRMLLLRAICWAAARVGVCLPALWYWPRGLPAVGLISHDSDHNIDRSARTTLALLERAGIASTWCDAWSPVWPASYSAETHALVRAAGHEIALHYNARPEDGGAWGEVPLRDQLAWLRRETGVERVASNKNHYLRWEGEVEFFRWLEAVGIPSDQSKGPSKKGNVGYPHGSCQPWFPYDAERGRFLDVLEIPLQTQDLWLTAPYAIAGPILEQSHRHHGVAHFLFHQVHLHHRPEVAAALLQVVADGRARGLEWWTGAAINDWERRRRAIAVTCAPVGDRGILLRAHAPDALPGATLALLPPAGSGVGAASAAVCDGQPVVLRAGEFHGLPALFCDVDLAAGTTVVEVRWPA